MPEVDPRTSLWPEVDEDVYLLAIHLLDLEMKQGIKDSVKVYLWASLAFASKSFCWVYSIRFRVHCGHTAFR